MHGDNLHTNTCMVTISTLKVHGNNFTLKQCMVTISTLKMHGNNFHTKTCMATISTLKVHGMTHFLRRGVSELFDCFKEDVLRAHSWKNYWNYWKN